MNNDYLKHYGVLGMHWGHRKASIEKTAYKVAATVNPREMKYKVRKVTNHANDTAKYIADATHTMTDRNGVLPTNKKALKAVETVGIKTHSEAQYANLTVTDIQRLKTYTNSARYSRSVNSYLAIGQPKEFAAQAQELKSTIQKNKISDLTVYRSCNLKFSVNGVSKKLDQYSEEELQTVFDSMTKNFNGKHVKEERVWSTSTSPLFAIDTWRAVNPTAASTYNTYMIIKCKDTPGILADGTNNGKAIVNTRSNQEAILAPSKLTYKKLAFDSERQMFAITVEAE